jgi:hypothetical protein
MFRGSKMRKQFVVTSKGCRRDVPSRLVEFPFQSVAVKCPLCQELSRYRPSEIFIGKPDHLVTRQNSMTGLLTFDPDSDMSRINKSMG